jgi:DNA-binding NtrC family response regulator
MNPIRILVIDDEAVIRNGCALIISDIGHSAETCSTGQAGLESITNSPPDIILLDLKLPDVDGLEILRSVKQTKPDVCIIVMTGYATVQTAVEAMKLGAFDYLSKPFSDDELILSVGRAVQTKRLVEENRSLRKELASRTDFDNIVGDHPRMLETFDAVLRVAPTEATVLICGESGTGKELFARAIHTHSQRATQPFVAVDCSTLAAGILESELFGHVKGAFTGALANKAGLFEAAHDGTLFLDDVTNLSVEVQAKLLRVLETQEYRPVGTSQSRRTNARIIAATNRDLKNVVDEGGFREDLYYRLNVLPIVLPPLRKRKEDIPKLAYYFLRHFCRKTGKRIEGFSDDALATLREYNWPGNVRQLKNVVERLVIMSDREVLDPTFMTDNLDMKGFLTGGSIPATVEELNLVKRQLLTETFGQVQKAFLMKALRSCHGNITRAAERVGMKRANFSALMKKHSLSAKDFND